MNNQLTLQNTAYIIIVLLGVGWFSYIAVNLWMPVVFAIIIAIFLYPINNFYQRKINVRVVSIFLSFLTIILPLALVIFLFSMQFIDIVDSLPSIGENLKVGVKKAISEINRAFPMLNLKTESLMSGGLGKSLGGPLSTISQGLITSTSIIVNLALCFIYTFFILYYRRSIKNFIVYLFEKSARKEVKETLREIQETIQAYIGGLGIVMVILTVLNTLGLYIIGIDHAFFWGALAGLLAVIPYIGTLLGGLLPFLYALATADANWQPVAVLIYYGLIQQIEGNLITPKIVGDKVDINPLFAILSLLSFGSLWGVGGVILALPIISIIRIILERFESTEPIAMLLSTDINSKPGQFKKWAENTKS